MKLRFSPVLIVCFLFMFNRNATSQSTYYNPVNPSLLPTYSANTPDWAKPLYNPQGITIKQIDKAYRKYYHRRWDDKEEEQEAKSGTGGLDRKEIEFEEGSDGWARYYMLWRPHIEQFIQKDGSLQLPSAQQYLQLNTITQIQPDVKNAAPVPATTSNTAASAAKGSSKANAKVWTHIGPNQTFWLKDDNSAQPQCPWQVNIYAFDISPLKSTLLVCGTESRHIYKTYNKGVSWNCINTTYNFNGSIEAIACDPQDSNEIYLSAGNYIYRTTNAGTGWSQLPNSSYSLQANDIAIYPTKNDTVYVGSDNGFYRTLNANGACSWTQIFTNAVYDIEQLAATPSTMFALRLNGTAVEFVKSTDAGATFSVSSSGWPTGLTDQDHARMAIQGNVIYVLWLTTVGPYLIKSTDAGATWTTASTPTSSQLGGVMGNGQGYYDLSIVINPSNTSQVILATNTSIKTTDGGTTYSSVGGYSGSFNIHPDIQEMKMTGSDCWIATDGGMSLSSDFFTSTSNYASKTTGIDGPGFWGFDQGWNEDITVGGRYHNGNTAMSEYYPAGYALRMGGAESATCYVLHNRTRSVAFSDLGGGGWVLPSTFYSLSGGRFTMSMYPNEGYPGYQNGEIAIHPLYYKTYYLGNGNEIWKSTDGGGNYTSLYNCGSTVREIEISRSNPNYIYFVANDYKVYKTTDGGTTWTAMNIPSGLWYGYFLDIAIDPTNENILWLLDRNQGGTSTKKIYKTTDGCVTWTNLTTTTLDGRYFNCMAHAGNSNGGVYLFAYPTGPGNGTGGNAYVYYRDNSMSDWALYNTGLPPGVDPLKAIPFYKTAKMRLCTGEYGRGIWEIPLYDSNFYPICQPSVNANTSLCARDTFYFDDYSILKQRGATYAWTFSPSPSYVSSTSVRNPKVVFGSTGSFNVSLTVTDNNGHSSSKTVNSMVTMSTSYCALDTVPGKAVKLYAATTDNITVPALPSNMNSCNTVTIMCWMKNFKVKPQADYSGIYITNGTACGMNFRVSGNFTYIGCHWNGTSIWSNMSADSIPRNKWTHVAITFDGSTNAAKIYINGKLSSTITGYTLSAFNFNGTTAQLGTYPGYGPSRTVDSCLIDEFCIYNTVLSLTTIQNEMHLTKKSTMASYSNLQLYYQFNEPSGDANDKIGLRHGSLSNATRVTSTGAFGGGSFSRLTVSALNTTYTFTAASVTLKTAASGTTPNGDLVITRLNIKPDNLATSAYPMARSYWVVNNYGANATFTLLQSIKFTKVGNVSTGDASTPSNFKMYKRNSSMDGATWGGVLSTATIATSSTDGDVTFGASNGITSFSMIHFSSQGSSLLPIGLLNFTAQIIDGKKETLLKWTTAYERHNRRFIIERSADGINFEEINTMDSKNGDVEFMQDYSFIDAAPMNGVNFYRLKQEDYNGEFTLSNIEQVYFSAEGSQTVLYPNPSSCNETIFIKNEWNEKVMVTIWSIDGKEIHTEEINGSGSLTMPHLESGTYLYKVQNEKHIQVGKMVVQ